MSANAISPERHLAESVEDTIKGVWWTHGRTFDYMLITRERFFCVMVGMGVDVAEARFTAAAASIGRVYSTCTLVFNRTDQAIARSDELRAEGFFVLLVI